MGSRGGLGELGAAGRQWGRLGLGPWIRTAAGGEAAQHIPQLPHLLVTCRAARLRLPALGSPPRRAARLGRGGRAGKRDPRARRQALETRSRNNSRRCSPGLFLTARPISLPHSVPWAHDCQSLVPWAWAGRSIQHACKLAWEGMNWPTRTPTLPLLRVPVAQDISRVVGEWWTNLPAQGKVLGAPALRCTHAPHVCPRRRWCRSSAKSCLGTAPCSAGEGRARPRASALLRCGRRLHAAPRLPCMPCPLPHRHHPAPDRP